MITDIKAHYQTIFASEEYARRFHPGADNPKPRKRKTLIPGGLYDLPAVAGKLNVTNEKVRGFVRAGDLKFINVGHGTKRSRYRFTDADINALIEKRKTQEILCPSSGPQSPRRISGSVFSLNVVGFTEARNARLEKKLKNSKR